MAMDENGPEQSSRPRRWLESIGYQIAFRCEGWTECLVWCDDERWLGRGGSCGGALEDALSQMLPSRAARLASPSFHASDAANHGPIVSNDEPREDSRSSDPVPEETASSPAESERSSPADVVPVSVEPQPDPALSVEDALRSLDPLEDRISAERPELGLATPERQRLVILGWICHARAVEDAAGHSPEVEERVHGIAVGLTVLSKLYWPGSVVGLQLHKMPEDTVRDLPATWKTAPPKTWEEAATAAEEALRQVEARDAKAGRDEYGWADSAMLAPAPLDPMSELNSLRAAVERLTGPVDRPVAKNVARRVKKLSAHEIESAVAWGRLVRWLRGFVTDFEVWGQLAGRLRWMAKELATANEVLREVLDPGSRPPQSWATLLRRDPEEKRRRRARQKLYLRLTDLHVHPIEADVKEWLRDGLDLIENGALAKALLPFSEIVCSIDGQAFLPGGENRRLRKRLAGVQEELTSSTGTSAPLPEVAAQIRLAREAPEEFEVERVDATAALLSTVRAITGGRRAVFVGNRADTNLKGALERDLGFASLDWCEGGTRRIDATAERIEAGAYDLVLGATGFQAHTTDRRLYTACRKTGATYVRVNKGRLVACAAAIARAMGSGAKKDLQGGRS
jgi:hypothetical protein